MKEKVVFIHYFGGNAESWKWTKDYLTPDIKPYFISLPGFGNTKAFKKPTILKMANYIVTYLKKHHIKECTLVGHSMGGKIALLTTHLTKKTTIQIKKVILIAPSPPTKEAMPLEEKQRMLKRTVIEAEKTVDNGTYTQLPEDIMTFCIHSQLQIDRKTWKWWLLKGMNTSIKKYTKNLKTPIYLICSEDDKAITQKMIIEDVLSNLKLEEISKTKHVGHLIPIEQPEYTAKTIENIIKK